MSESRILAIAQVQELVSRSILIIDCFQSLIGLQKGVACKNINGL